MSYLILCNGTMTNNPYYFEFTDTRIYSIEELCYYIYNNIYIIEKKIFTKELATWIDEELGMYELSEKINFMIDNDKSLKDIIVTILCSADYYFEEDIKKLIKTIDKIDGLPNILRRKIKADNFLRCHNYALAEKEYNDILSSYEIKNIDVKEQGNILHNLAIVKLYTSSIKSASRKFKEAYLKNENAESLKQYLYSIRLCNDEKQFEEEVHDLSVSNEILAEVADIFKRTVSEACNTDKYIQIKRLNNIKKDGRVSEYYEIIDKLVLEWKKDYKREQIK